MCKKRLIGLLLFLGFIMTAMFFSNTLTEYPLLISIYIGVFYLIYFIASNEKNESFFKLDSVLILFIVHIMPQKFQIDGFLMLILFAKSLPLLYTSLTDKEFVPSDGEYSINLVWGIISILVLRSIDRGGIHSTILSLALMMVIREILMYCYKRKRYQTMYSFISSMIQSMYVVLSVFLALSIYNSLGMIHSMILLALFKAFEVSSKQHVLHETEFKHLMKDDLTGIYNKAYLKAILNKHVLKGTEFNLIMIDLDDFKDINDTYGHLAGDRALVHFVRLITKRAGLDNTFRYGGDEFCVIATKKIDVDSLVCGLQGEIELNPILVEGKEIFLKASFGVYRYDGIGDNVEDVIHMADKNMYRMKKKK